MTSLQSVEPVFIRDRDIGETVTAMDLCRAVTRVINESKLEGVQKVNGVWRIYVKDRATRIELRIKSTITVKGKQISLYDQNPNVIFHGSSGTQGLPLRKMINSL